MPFCLQAKFYPQRRQAFCCARRSITAAIIFTIVRCNYETGLLYYEVRGTGRPLVLIHGWQCSHVFWQRNVDELARDFTVVTPDLRGHGNSSKGLHGITIKQFACDVYDLINYLDLKDAVVMGWSMGGPHGRADCAFVF